jgi:ABC-2 type transport system ATP-binding protein
MSIQVKNLTKVFGHQKALDQVSFSIGQGEIVGFLGPNGAGKSTTMKIATCYLPPTSGSLEICGLDVIEQPLKVRQQVGYLPEHNPLYLDMYVHEYLGFIGHIHKLRGKELRDRVKRVVQMFGLGKEQNKLIGSLSKGYRQRVGLAQALIHDPKVLILDEPTTGLDPNQITEIRNLILEVSKEKTVLFSTHIMQEVQAICQRVVIIDNGKIVADKAVSQLQVESADNKSLQRIRVTFQNKVSKAELALIPEVQTVSQLEDGSFLVSSAEAQDIRAAIFNHAVNCRWTLIELTRESNSLESVFKQLTGQGGQGD